MNHLNSSLFAKKASLWDKKLVFILCCSLALGTMTAQQSVTLNYTGSIVQWTVPANCVSAITINAVGATGGKANAGPGGLGASMTGTFTVTPGQVLNILVGGAGIEGPDCNDDAGGGGGTFVATANNVPMIVAGGGGGSSANSTGINATINQCGSAGSGNGAAGGCGGSGGTANYGPSGAGFYGNGVNAPAWGSSAGLSFVNGGTGGASPYQANGGFGGGAGAYGDCCIDGGAGGGYSGGGSAGTNGCSGAGGGGSYNAGLFQINDSAANSSGNGSVTITYGSLEINTVAIGSEPCNGESAAIIAGVPIGTSGPYVYSWAPLGATSDTVTGVSAGTYTITISDGCGHTSTAAITVTQPAPLNVTTSASKDVSCSGGSNGVASAFASGGTGPYTYSWSPVSSSNTTIFGLSAGTYTVDVIDAHGCVTLSHVTITQPEPISVTASSTNVTCNGGNNGNGTASASGGSSPYNYSWSDGQTNYIAVGLTAGTYTVNVTDKNGCSGSAGITITQPANVSVSASVSSGIKCYGGSAGVSATISGGALPYTYLWSNGATTAFVGGLTPGTYNVSVSDYCGGSATATVTVTQPASAISDSATTAGNITCNGDNDGCAVVFASGGTNPYNYMWSDPNNQTTATACGLSAGTYNVNVIDANGCSTSATTTITQPTALSVTANSTTVLSECTGSAWVKASGGTPGYTYSWSNGKVTDSISGLCAGSYCCKVTDANGCEKNLCVNVVSTTGIANLTGGTEGITVYPNPNSGQFTIESAPLTGQSTVEIYNVLGEKVYSQYSTFDAPLSVNLGNQANGIYLYRVISESGSLLGEGKIVLQK